MPLKRHILACFFLLQMMDSTGNVQVSLVNSKIKVAPTKRLTILSLELCGAYLLAQLLHHVKKLFDLSIFNVYAWMDSTILLSWLVGNLRHFTRCMLVLLSSSLLLVVVTISLDIVGLFDPSLGDASLVVVHQQGLIFKCRPTTNRECNA